jgi:cytochrome oxidase Cu insertion factor (SCO1/SenC/PrrC family)
MTEGPTDRAAATPPTSAPGPLSATERAAAFTDGTTAVDRAAALRAGSTPVPRKFIAWIIVAFAVLSFGGLLAEHFTGNGSAASSTAPPTTFPSTGNSAPATPVPSSAPPISGSLSAFIGLKRLVGATAPAIDLEDQNGAPWSLAGVHGKVVVLTFFDSPCNDICPILSTEIAEAKNLLGAQRSADVDFVVVNSDPLATSLVPNPAGVAGFGPGSPDTFLFLNGPLNELNGIWSSYGVTVTVQKSTNLVTHNNIMYFIDPQGRTRFLATPFANEDQLGTYSLAPADVQRFAQGVANTAASLVGTSP